MGGSALTTASPSVSAAEAERIASRHYGMTARAERLPGEKDENFRLRGRSQDRFLKIAHAAEPAQVTNLSTSALLHLAGGAGDLPVQRVIPTLDGAFELEFATEDGDARRARMTTFLDGRPLRSVPSSRALRENLGRALARLAVALRSFEHPQAGRELLWDLQHADKMWPLLGELDGLPHRELLTSCLERFEADVRPRLSSLRTQPVHNDFNGDNVLVADDATTVTGVIDFGDMVVTHVVSDLAVAASVQVGEGDDPIGPAIDVVRGYHRVVPLAERELEVLYDLIRVRTAMHIVITEWRSSQFPANRAYIMRRTPRAWACLERLPAAAAPEVGRRLIDACYTR